MYYLVRFLRVRDLYETVWLVQRAIKSSPLQTVVSMKSSRGGTTLTTSLEAFLPTEEGAFDAESAGERL